MTLKAALKILCLTAVAAPTALAAVTDLTITPIVAAVLALLALAGGITLSELQPGLSGGLTSLSSEDIGRLADELLKRQAADHA